MLFQGFLSAKREPPLNIVERGGGGGGVSRASLDVLKKRKSLTPAENQTRIVQYVAWSQEAVTRIFLPV